MSNYTSPQLVPPPREEEVYPYRPAWRSIAIETGILLVISGVIWVLYNFVGFRVPTNLRLPVNVFFALTPTLLWLLFSRLTENVAPEPRRRLFTTFVVSALAANAVGVPLVEGFLQPDRWLAQATAIERIIGFATTLAIVQEFLKFLVLRSLIWPDFIRVRGDSIAYGAATAIGYATVLNLHILFATPEISLDSLALRVLAYTTVQVAASIIVSYGFS
ncbi:MAG: PrsW family intramembrane metalloprotease, partial [Anaerolineae bacterium]|nr:PrsW family intramembrane metalloprotease [Anaerolineae bacterium]